MTKNAVRNFFSDEFNLRIFILSAARDGDRCHILCVGVDVVPLLAFVDTL